MKSGNGKNGNDDKDDDDGDDDVFEDYNEGTDKYLNFLHDEEQSQRDGSAESYSSVHYSSLDDDSFAGDSQGASGGTFEDVYRWVCALALNLNWGHCFFLREYSYGK